MGKVRVKIGEIKLGDKAAIGVNGGETRSKPNPKDITWEQEFGIEIHKPTGRKPITQVTSPEALWYATINFNTVEDLERDRVIALGIGPHYVVTAGHKHCMYLKRKRMVQPSKTDDGYSDVSLQLVEANDGGS